MACPHGTTSAKWCTKCINEEREEEKRREREAAAQLIREADEQASNNAHSVGVIDNQPHVIDARDSGGVYPAGYLKAAQSWDMGLAVVSRIAVMNGADLDRVISNSLTTPFDRVDQTFSVRDLNISTHADVQSGRKNRHFTMNEIRFYMEAVPFTEEMRSFYTARKREGVQYRARHVNDPSFPCTMCGKKRHTNDKRPFSAVATVPFDLLDHGKFTTADFNNVLGDGKRKWVCDSCARFLLLPLVHGCAFSAYGGQSSVVTGTDSMRKVDYTVSGPERFASAWMVASLNATSRINYNRPDLIVED